MATLKELRTERLRKLQQLRELGVDPYPAAAKRSDKIATIKDSFVTSEGSEVVVAGRIMHIRKFGKIAFIVIRDMSGTIQLFLATESMAELDASMSQLGYDQLPLLDSGDFVEARGTLIRTQTGEISVAVKSLRLLTKSLRPLPAAQEGFTNKEERLRRRYVDMNVNESIRDRFIRRSAFWQATREYLLGHGFIEINIPVLEHTTGGADANPFVTHMDALNQDFYLRISHELPLKRLIGGGYEKVFDIGPRFRNENYSDEHLPEHVAMEWYWAYADWQDGMKFMTDMYRFVLKKTFGTLKFKIGSFAIDLEQEWEIWDYAETIKKHYDLDVYTCSLNEVKNALAAHKLEVEQTESKARGIDKLWKNIRKDVGGPVWLVNTPLFISPLAKINPNNPNTVERFQPVIAGTEMGNGWSELNDPIDQLQRFLDQQRMRDAGDDEAQMLDIDYVEMLEYGMPPSCGWGYSERVFWVFEGVTAREGVPFSHLRRELDETTKMIYPELFESHNGHPRNIEREQDFSKRIVAVVNKELEPWRVVNAVEHMTAIIGNEVPKAQLVSGDYFIGSDGGALPRNSQYPIIVMRASERDLHKLFDKVRERNLIHHVFIKEMQDTTNDKEIVDSVESQGIDETEFFGVTFLAPNAIADELTKELQLWK